MEDKKKIAPKCSVQCWQPRSPHGNSKAANEAISTLLPTNESAVTLDLNRSDPRMMCGTTMGGFGPMPKASHHISQCLNGEGYINPSFQLDGNELREGSHVLAYIIQKGGTTINQRVCID